IPSHATAEPDEVRAQRSVHLAHGETVGMTLQTIQSPLPTTPHTTQFSDPTTPQTTQFSVPTTQHLPPTRVAGPLASAERVGAVLTLGLWPWERRTPPNKL